MSYDVIVVGLGGMGSAAAAHLAARGSRVLGLERHTPAHDLGSSHGGSRIVRQTYFEGAAYVPLLLRSYELWERLVRDSDVDLLTLCGGLFLGAPDSTTVSGSLLASRTWDLPHELLDAGEVRRRFPTVALPEGDVGLFEAQAGVVRPEATVRAHLTIAERAGADLRFREPVLSWEETASGVRVATSAGTYEAGQLVLAPGPWAPELLDVPVEVERQVTYWFQPAGGTAAYVDHPIWIHDDGEVQAYGFPALDGPQGGVKVAFFRGGATCTPDTIDREVAGAEVEEVRRHVGRLLPGSTDRFLRAVTCMYSNTPDHHFAIARWPGLERVTVACGFSGHGFKFVPVVGEVLADLVTTGTTGHPIGLFDPRRPALTRAG